ncbi:MAG: metal-dependent hydrolase [Bacilli bacterium]|nr:metal-dependent hydrolase [Bacilli bacterium]
MNGNCHFMYGATVGIMLTVNLDTISTILPQIANTQEMGTLFVLGGLMGGIFPDIDNPSSHMGKLSKPISTIIGAINKKFGKVGANHRGILHDPIVYIIGLILSYIFMPSLIGIFIGCLSHLFLDMFNYKGIPFFLFKRISVAKIESDSTGSTICTVLWILVTVVLGIFIKIRTI